MLENTRLGIPITFTQETMTSGARNGTSFPHPVAQGSSWNMTLVHRIATAVATEAYYSGVDRGYSPVLQVVTDPRSLRVQGRVIAAPSLFVSSNSISL